MSDGRFVKGQTAWNKGKPCAETTKQKIGLANKGNEHSEVSKKLISEGMIGNKNSKGISRSEETRTKISDSVKKSYNEDLRTKRRVVRVKQIVENNGISHPSYNREACEFFKSFDEQNKTKGRYAVYGNGEFYIEQLGYWVDYFNLDLKLIMEFDEKHHYLQGKLKHKDVIRQKQIQELYPDFEFKRIRE
jgi:hypothetical protein